MIGAFWYYDTLAFDGIYYSRAYISDHSTFYPPPPSLLNKIVYTKKDGRKLSS